MSEGLICDGCGRARPYTFVPVDMPEGMALAMTGGVPLKRVPPDYIVLLDPDVVLAARAHDQRHFCDYNCLELWSMSRRIPREVDN